MQFYHIFIVFSHHLNGGTEEGDDSLSQENAGSNTASLKHERRALTEHWLQRMANCDIVPCHSLMWCNDFVNRQFTMMATLYAN
jgi:hypothetical protein